ncbi:hypothetical protein Drorol1_Dr00014766 [Drosera rotundifolia]
MADSSSSPQTQPLITHNNSNHPPPRPRKDFSRALSHARDELHSFRSCLHYLCIDHNANHPYPNDDRWVTFRSWFVFVLLSIVVPFFSHFFVSCEGRCKDDPRHLQPYDAIVQLSLSSVAALSFLHLSRLLRDPGLRTTLLFDQLIHESRAVNQNYTQQLDKSLRICTVIVLPCFIADSAYKIWWYTSGSPQIPFIGNAIAGIIVACLLELLSWLYRTTLFFLVCVLFRLNCYLQLLRLREFARTFELKPSKVPSDPSTVLDGHWRVRQQLKIISHRFRVFILWSLILITMSQFASLLVTTKSHADVNLFNAGELALCSMTLMAGLTIILRSATKITHKAQEITSLAAAWHAGITVILFGSDAETPAYQDGNARFLDIVNGDSDCEGLPNEEDDAANDKGAYVDTPVLVQKRQAVVKYLENNRAGITVYGFTLDRTWLQLIFGIELSLVLWLLGKTVGIS